jgi:hypothetical protein
MNYKKQLMLVRHLRKTKGKVTKCPDAYGMPYSTLTVRPKNHYDYGLNRL